MQVRLTKLEHEVNISIICSDVDSMQLDKIVMITHFGLNLNLTQSPYRVNLVNKSILNFLDSYTVSV